jgi:hypothetical protein
VNWQAALFAFFCLFAAICFVCVIVHEVRKGPKKPQATRRIHLPRETLWARTNRYHGEDTQ